MAIIRMPSMFKKGENSVAQSAKVSTIGLQQAQKGHTAVSTALAAMKLGDAVMESKVLDFGAKEIKSWFDPSAPTLEDAVGRIPQTEGGKRAQALQARAQGLATARAESAAGKKRWAAAGADYKGAVSGHEDVLLSGKMDDVEFPAGDAGRTYGQLIGFADRLRGAGKSLEGFVGSGTFTDAEVRLMRAYLGGDEYQPAGGPVAKLPPAPAPAATPGPVTSKLSAELDALTAGIERQPAAKRFINRQRVRKLVKSGKIGKELAVLLDKANRKAMGAPTAYGPKTMAAAKEMAKGMAGAPQQVAAPAAPPAPAAVTPMVESIKRANGTFGENAVAQPPALSPGGRKLDAGAQGREAASMAAFRDGERMAAVPIVNFSDPAQAARYLQDFSSQLLEDEKLPKSDLPRDENGYVDIDRLRGLGGQQALLMAAKQVWTDDETAALAAVASEGADLQTFFSLAGRQYKKDAASLVWAAQSKRREDKTKSRVAMYKSVAQIIKSTQHAQHYGAKATTETSKRYKNYMTRSDWTKRARVKGSLSRLHKSDDPSLWAQVNYSVRGGSSDEMTSARFMDAPAYKDKYAEPRVVGGRTVTGPTYWTDDETRTGRVVRDNALVLGGMSEKDRNAAMKGWKMEQGAERANNLTAQGVTREQRLNTRRVKVSAKIQDLEAKKISGVKALKHAYNTIDAKMKFMATNLKTVSKTVLEDRDEVNFDGAAKSLATANAAWDAHAVAYDVELERLKAVEAKIDKLVKEHTPADTNTNTNTNTNANTDANTDGAGDWVGLDEIVPRNPAAKRSE